MTRFLAAALEWRLPSRGWAMRRLWRRRSAGLRPEPLSTQGLGLSAAAAIARTGLVVLVLILTILLPMIFAGA
jgi:hypothetical protein